MKHLTVKEKEIASFDKLKETFEYKGRAAAPRVLKIVINTGTGTSVKKNKDINNAIIDRLAKITGQKGRIEITQAREEARTADFFYFKTAFFQ